MVRDTRSVARLSGFKSQLHPLYQLCALLCPRRLFFMTKQAQPCVRVKGLMLVKCEAYSWHTGSAIKIRYSSCEFIHCLLPAVIFSLSLSAPSRSGMGVVAGGSRLLPLFPGMLQLTASRTVPGQVLVG